MLIVVEYKNGRVKEFDPSSFSSSVDGKGVNPRPRNACVEYDLRLDLIREEGLRLDIYWYDASLDCGDIELDDVVDSNGYTVSISKSGRSLGTSVTIVNKAVLNNVSRIIVQRGGVAVTAIWRQGEGNWLIEGTKFDSQRVLTYTDATTTSINAMATRVFSYLASSNPDLNRREICELIGYPEGAIDEIVQSESHLSEKVIDPPKGCDGAPTPTFPEERNEMLNLLDGANDDDFEDVDED